MHARCLVKNLEFGEHAVGVRCYQTFGEVRAAMGQARRSMLRGEAARGRTGKDLQSSGLHTAIQLNV